MLNKSDKKYIRQTIENSIEKKVPQIVADTLKIVLVNYPTKLDLEDKLTKFRSDILNRVDAVMGEVKAMREDFVIINNRSANNRDSIEDHENRINVLEDKLIIN